MAEIFQLDSFVRGWFCGSFADGKTIFETKDYEVAVKRYRKDDPIDPLHYHLAADEITCLISGKARMKDREYSAGEIIVICRGEATDFECLSDELTSVVVKSASVAGDKFLVSEGTVFGKCLTCNGEREQSSLIEGQCYRCLNGS